MKLLTITIPCYNSQDYMEKSICSALTGGDRVEIIIVDDGSSDNTLQIAKKYEEKFPNIVRVIHQENGGHGEAVNTGIKNATGLYFKVVDSDDCLGRKALEKVLNLLEEMVAKDAGLEGKTVNRITYIMSDGAYVYEFADGIYIKPQATEEMDVSPEFTDSTHVKLANLDKYKNPKVSVFYTTGVGHASETTYLVQDAVTTDGVVALDSTVARPENETYTVRVSSDGHADVSVQLVYGTIAFKENSGVLYIGSSRQLEATGENCKDVTYASDNETVASVDENGKVTAKAAGTAVITATSAAGKTAQYKLTVKTPSVKMNASAKTLYVKGSPATVTLKATTAGVTGKVTYTSSKPSVAAVAANGKVTAKAAGTAVITAKCGNYKATCKITVKKPSVKASASAKTVFVGGTSQIKVKKTGVSGKVTYTSSNKSVAVVSAGGKVTAKKAGTATIAVKCGSYKATCRITVKKGSLKITSKTAVSVKAKKTTAIKAAATSKAKITYRSSNTKVATVSSKGVVKGVKKGKAVIYVSSNGITKKVTVTVK